MWPSFSMDRPFGMLLGYRSILHSIKKYMYSLLETCSPRLTVLYIYIYGCVPLSKPYMYALTCQSFFLFLSRYTTVIEIDLSFCHQLWIMRVTVIESCGVFELSVWNQMAIRGLFSVETNVKGNFFHGLKGDRCLI